jgi:hypothetical protein
MLDGLGGAEIEQRAAAGAPFFAVEMKDGGSGAQIGDVGIVFHRSAFDSPKADRHANQRPQAARVSIASEGDGVVEIAIDPFQAARLAALRGQREEAGLQPLAPQVKQLAGLLQVHLPRPAPHAGGKDGQR